MSDQPSWYRCTDSSNRLFTSGVAYEVLRHEGGSPVICTDQDRRMIKLPVEGVQFEPHDPWKSYRKSSP